MIFGVVIGLFTGYYIASPGASYAAALAVSCVVFITRVVISGRNEAADAIGLLVFFALALISTAATRAYRNRQRKRVPY